jgi:hypothetical protein
MANEIARFGDLILFFLVVLGELIVKCVIGFDRIVTILEDQWPW